jgi:hypothetical protein
VTYPNSGVLEPDRDQLEMFGDALLRHVSNSGYVSVRAFYEDASGKSFRISPASLKGGLKFLFDVLEDDARRAAQSPKPVVFCPPLCTFVNKEHAREQDILEGFALSVECDNHPQEARQKLEALLGPATVVVTSGGRWSNGDGKTEDKLHLHWRLARPAQAADIPKLKQARMLAAKLVGGIRRIRRLIIQSAGRAPGIARPSRACVRSRHLILILKSILMPRFRNYAGQHQRHRTGTGTATTTRPTTKDQRIGRRWSAASLTARAFITR